MFTAFTVQLNEKHYQGTLKPKAAAANSYSDAISASKQAVLLETDAPGSISLSIGNLKSGTGNQFMFLH